MYQNGILRTLVSAFVYGIVFMILRSPVLMLVLGFIIGFIFPHFFPDQAAEVTQFIFPSDVRSGSQVR